MIELIATLAIACVIAFGVTLYAMWRVADRAPDLFDDPDKAEAKRNPWQ